MKSFFPLLLRKSCGAGWQSRSFRSISFVRPSSRQWQKVEIMTKVCYFERLGGGERRERKKRISTSRISSPLPSRIVFRSFRICIAPIWKNGFHTGFTRLPRLKLCNQRNESRSSDRIYPARIYSLYNGSSFLKKKEILIQRSKT